MSKFLKMVLFALVFFSSINFTSAQLKDTTFSHPPKVGLVLSGGGAKGYAHLPALKLIDKLGIKIDYIAGTSVGSIIGGLYAAGYSVEQIDSIARMMDLYTLVLKAPERKYKTFYDKNREGRTWFRLPFDHFKISIPSGISSGQSFINAICDWTIPIHGINDFDSLPVPYFCKITALSKGESIKVTNGVMAEAIRASSGYPSLFEPFEIDGELYVDGGIFDNYPIDEMKKKGADIIIGIDINGGLLAISKQSSIVNVLSQLVTYQIVENSKKQLKNLDLNIKPNLDEFTAMSFANTDTIFARGFKAAFEAYDELKEIADLQKKWGIKAEPRKNLILPSNYLITNIEFEGNTKYTDDYILGRFDINYPINVTLDDIHQSIDKLYATGNFTNVYYNLIPNKEDNSYILKLFINEKPVKQYIGLGWSYDNLYKARLLVNFQYNTLAKNSIFELDAIIGSNPSFYTSFFWDNGFKPSLGVNLNVGYLSLRTYLDSPEIAPYANRINVNISSIVSNFYIQSTLDQKLTGGFGIELSYFDIVSPTFSVNGKSLPLQQNFFTNPYVYLNLDTRDDKFLPTKGLYYDLMFKIIIEHKNSENVRNTPSFFKGNLSHTIRISRHFSLIGDAFAGYSFGTTLPYAYKFFIGGTRDIMPFNFVEFYGLPFFWNSDLNDLNIGVNTFLKASAKFVYRPAPIHNIFTGFNYGFIGYDGNILDRTKSIYGVNLGYGIKTPVGPIQILGTYSPFTNRDKFGWQICAGFYF